MRMLRCGDTAGKVAAAGVLSLLILTGHVQIMEAGAVAPLVKMLRCDNVAGKEWAANALWMLAFFNSINRAAIKAAHGL